MINQPMKKEEKATGITTEHMEKNRMLYLDDGIHPNNLGYEVLSTIYEEWLKSI